jgi:hypothetical protein
MISAMGQNCLSLMLKDSEENERIQGDSRKYEGKNQKLVFKLPEVRKSNKNPHYGIFWFSVCSQN